MALLKEVGYGPDKPVKIKFFTTNGVFPNDFDMARAIGAMWKKVGIDADIEVIELSTYQERLRAGTLPEATMYQWGNAAGDPEMYGGYLLDPKAIFSAYKAEDLMHRIRALLVGAERAEALPGVPRGSPLRGREGLLHPPTAEYADRGSPEQRELREVRQRLDPTPGLVVQVGVTEGRPADRLILGAPLSDAVDPRTNHGPDRTPDFPAAPPAGASDRAVRFGASVRDSPTAARRPRQHVATARRDG